MAPGACRVYVLGRIHVKSSRLLQLLLLAYAYWRWCAALFSPVHWRLWADNMHVRACALHAWWAFAGRKRSAWYAYQLVFPTPASLPTMASCPARHASLNVSLPHEDILTVLRYQMFGIDLGLIIGVVLVPPVMFCGGALEE